MFYDPPAPETLDCKIFSPFYSQMRAELGSSCMFPVTDCSNGNDGVPFQYGTNEPDDIANFLNNILNDREENISDELGSENNLQSEAYAQGANLKVR